MPNKTKPFLLKKKQIKTGDKGDEIVLIQRYLKRFGYLRTNAKEGQLNATTITALKRFQKQMNLPLSGKIDKKTRKALQDWRCGTPDDPSDTNITALRKGFKLSDCKHDKLDLRYRFDTPTNDITADEQQTAIRSALQSWSKVCALKFREVSGSTDLRFAWATGSHGDGEPFDGIGNVLAHAFYPDDCGGTHKGKCHFDDAETWRVNGSSFDLETVALHEIGHLIGLKHSTNPDAVMYASYQGLRRVLTQDDIDGATRLYRGNVHIQQITGNGAVGRRAGTHQWTDGWTSVLTYSIGGSTYLFLLKRAGAGADGKNVHLHRFDPDGDVGSRIASYSWTSGWTSASFFPGGTSLFLFLLKASGDGSDGKNVHIQRINADGTVGARAASYKWTSGWSNACFYSASGHVYLFLLKQSGYGSDGKNVHIHRMNANGTVGARTASYKWTSGWTTAFCYSVSGNTFLFLLKQSGYGSDGKNVHIQRVNSDGTIGSRAASYKWTSGWTTAFCYTVSGTTYLFLLKKLGYGSDENNVHIHRMNANGTVGARVANYRWTKGWTSAKTYSVGASPFLFLLKEQTME